MLTVSQFSGGWYSSWSTDTTLSDNILKRYKWLVGYMVTTADHGYVYSSASRFHRFWIYFQLQLPLIKLSLKSKFTVFVIMSIRFMGRWSLMGSTKGQFSGFVSKVSKFLWLLMLNESHFTLYGVLHYFFCDKWASCSAFESNVCVVVVVVVNA